jgi:hypothetical protein
VGELFGLLVWGTADDAVPGVVVEQAQRDLSSAACIAEICVTAAGLLNPLIAGAAMGS